jgi:hypothetical protein
VDWYDFIDVSEVCTASIIRVMTTHPLIALMMEAVQASETLAN